MMFLSKKSKVFFRLRTILLIVNLTVLLLPLLGIFFFRFYENALVRQTELELIAQAAVISSVYQQNISGQLSGGTSYGREIDPSNVQKIDEYYTPIFPQIDLSTNSVMPPRPDGDLALAKADIFSLLAGERLAPILQETQKTTLSGIKVLDYNGITVAGQNETGMDFSFLPEVQAAMSGKYSSLIRRRISDEPTPALASISRGTGIRVFVAFPVIHNSNLWGIIYLSRTPQNVLKHLYAEKEKVFLVGFVALTLTMLLALLTSYTISKPLHRLIRKTQEFTSGDSNALLPMDNPVIREIDLLSSSFVSMAKALQDRANYIKEFAMHVSHEFKTPMTSIQGSAELLLEHLDDMEEEKKRKFLSNIIADSNRLKRLVNRLLEVAKADNYRPENQESSVLVTFDILKARYRDHGLNVEISGKEDCVVPMAQEHLETILSNLCDNAYQEGAEKVTLDLHIQGKTASILVTDNGKGISPANKDKIFTPFFTTKRDQGGTGLGLRIVQSLLEAHNASIAVCDHDEGAKFEIIIPYNSL